MAQRERTGSHRDVCVCIMSLYMCCVHSAWNFCGIPTSGNVGEFLTFCLNLGTFSSFCVGSSSLERSLVSSDSTHLIASETGQGGLTEEDPEDHQSNLVEPSPGQ